MRRCNGRAALVIASALLAAFVPASVAAGQSVSRGEMQLAQQSPAARMAAKKNSSMKAVPAARTTPTWRFTRRAGIATLEYGAASAGESLISFSCEPDSDLVRVISFIGSRGLRPGDGAAIRLSNGKARFEIAATAFSTEARDIVDIGGATQIDSRLFALFRAGDTLIVDVPGRRRTLPMATARQSADAFEKACMAGPGRRPPSG